MKHRRTLTLVLNDEQAVTFDALTTEQLQRDVAGLFCDVLERAAVKPQRHLRVAP